jgi:cytochrome P450
MAPRGLNEARKEEFAFASRRARERMSQGSTDRTDFMSYILKYNDEKGYSLTLRSLYSELTSIRMTPGEIESNSSILIIAGSETSTYPPSLRTLSSNTVKLQLSFPG